MRKLYHLQRSEQNSTVYFFLIREIFLIVGLSLRLLAILSFESSHAGDNFFTFIIFLEAIALAASAFWILAFIESFLVELLLISVQPLKLFREDVIAVTNQSKSRIVALTIRTV